MTDLWITHEYSNVKTFSDHSIDDVLEDGHKSFVQ